MTNKHLIFVIDDDSCIVDDLEDSIHSLGHDVVTAQNQVDALQIFKKKRPCLVLLDLAIKTNKSSAQSNMQIGFNLLQQIRAQFSRDELPVILITAHKQDNDQLGIRGMRCDANDMVKKPFENGQLESRIAHFLDHCPVHARASVPNHDTGKVFVVNKDIQTKDCMHFDGRSNTKRRNLILINDKETWVQTKSFEILWKLAMPHWRNQSGWLKAAQIDTSTNPRLPILRARRDIAKSVVDAGRIIENNGNQYRLSIPAKLLTYDKDLIKQYFPALYDLLFPPK